MNGACGVDLVIGDGVVAKALMGLLIPDFGEFGGGNKL